MLPGSQSLSSRLCRFFPGELSTELQCCLCVSRPLWSPACGPSWGLLLRTSEPAVEAEFSLPRLDKGQKSEKRVGLVVASYPAFTKAQLWNGDGSPQAPLRGLPRVDRFLEWLTGLSESVPQGWPGLVVSRKEYFGVGITAASGSADAHRPELCQDCCWAQSLEQRLCGERFECQVSEI